MKEEFYTQKRWNNWISKVKESKFKLTESEENATGAVFVYIMDDVVLACLKVIARLEKGLIDKEEALNTIDGINDIVSQEHESLGEDADMMIESLRTSLVAVFVSCRRYLEGSFDTKTPLAELLEMAIKAEADEDIDRALDLVTSIGARIVGGEAMPEMGDMDYCIVAEFMDGIDAISAAMLGDDSYKEDDGSADTGDDA